MKLPQGWTQAQYDALTPALKAAWVKYTTTGATEDLAAFTTALNAAYPQASATTPAATAPDTGTVSGQQGDVAARGIIQGTPGILGTQESQPSDIFQQFLSRQQGLSPLSRDLMGNQESGVYSNFLLNGAPGGSFRDYLGQGNVQPLTGEGALSRIKQIAGMIGSNDPNAAYYNDPTTFGAGLTGNKNAFNAYVPAAVQKINPFFRGAAQNIAQQDFNKFQGTTPEQSFLQYLAQKGGYFN